MFHVENYNFEHFDWISTCLYLTNMDRPKVNTSVYFTNRILEYFIYGMRIHLDNLYFKKSLSISISTTSW